MPKRHGAGRCCTIPLSHTHSTGRRVLYEFLLGLGRRSSLPSLRQGAGYRRPSADWAVVRRACRWKCRCGCSISWPAPLVRRVERPQVDLTTLQALRGILDKAAAGDGRELPPSSTASDDPADLNACDRKSGAAHAPNPGGSPPSYTYSLIRTPATRP